MRTIRHHPTPSIPSPYLLSAGCPLIEFFSGFVIKTCFRKFPCASLALYPCGPTSKVFGVCYLVGSGIRNLRSSRALGELLKSSPPPVYFSSQHFRNIVIFISIRVSLYLFREWDFMPMNYFNMFAAEVCEHRN